jgi:membrane protein implicated in regulation of membrane protease activity
LQAVLFSVFALVSVGIYLKWFRRRAPGSDQPLLNRRADQLIGQVVRLDQAIVAGRGRVQIADAFWTVEGRTSRRARRYAWWPWTACC